MRYFTESLAFENPTQPGIMESIYTSRPLPKWKRKLPMTSDMKHMQKLYSDSVYTTEVIYRNYK